MGHPPIRDRRKVDPEPPKLVSKAKAKKPSKNYGWQYDWEITWGNRKGELKPSWVMWYETPEQRDQALAVAIKKARPYQKNFRKVDRY